MTANICNFNVHFCAHLEKSFSIDSCVLSDEYGVGRKTFEESLDAVLCVPDDMVNWRYNVAF